MLEVVEIFEIGEKNEMCDARETKCRVKMVRYGEGKKYATHDDRTCKASIDYLDERLKTRKIFEQSQCAGV